MLFTKMGRGRETVSPSRREKAWRRVSTKLPPVMDALSAARSICSLLVPGSSVMPTVSGVSVRGVGGAALALVAAWTAFAVFLFRPLLSEFGIRRDMFMRRRGWRGVLGQIGRCLHGCYVCDIQEPRPARVQRIALRRAVQLVAIFWKHLEYSRSQHL